MTGAPAPWIMFALLATPIFVVIVAMLLIAAVYEWVNRLRHARAEKQRVSAYLARLVD